MSRVHHQIKCWPKYFQAIIDRKKTFEIRKNDRNYKIGDTLLLKEWNPETGEYTGRWELREIVYIIQGEFGLPEDICVMQLR